ncbi:hypothetical protein VNO77_44370 [Canavalia gladiata]|uniref:Subtilisin-like protease fibronectin type-III domain-containing protein n=1 Tax=Canavalia gladiata TaxID=3824 RepID=A0AAN9JVW9_CANGL
MASFSSRGRNIVDPNILKRTVSNVGSSMRVSKFSAISPKEYSITATPNILKFNCVGEQMNITITMTANNKHGPDQYYFGWYAWTDEHHIVRSPVAVSFP